MMDREASHGGIRVILLEDNPLDAELVQAILDQTGIDAELRVVDSQLAFERLLDEWPCDLVMSDYSMPAFDGASALAVAKARRPDVPFIFVSGSIGEERAVEAMRHGATDYVLKDRLSKLPIVVRRALAEGRERRARLEAQRALAEREREYRALVEEVPGLFYIASLQTGRLTTVISPQIESMLGYSQAEWVSDPELWCRCMHPDDRDHIVVAWKRHSGDRSAFDMEYRLLAKDGRTVWVRDVARFFGEPPVVRGFAVDITQRKQLEEQYLHAQKMEALGRLAGGVAHDFNNLLTVINGYSELLAAETAEGHPARADLAMIRDAGERAQTLTRQLLAFSRRQVVQLMPLHLGELLDGMSKMLARLVGDDISISTTAAHDIGLVRADRGQLEQVVMNLVVNARDAMPTGGRIDITVENVAGDTGAHVRLSVSDSGEGIPAEVLDRIFEPFFTTKEGGKGTGLGLAMVHGIVTQAGGATTVESAVGRGTTFRILLPVYQNAGNTVVTATSSPIPPSGGHETVMLVEDFDGVRQLATKILERLGYHVLAARDAADALRRCQEHEGEIHLLLTDIVMRPMTGLELARLVRRMQPSIRVLYMSGYSDRELDPQEVASESVSFVAKPFTTDELSAKVREALATPTREIPHGMRPDN